MLVNIPYMEHMGIKPWFLRRCFLFSGDGIHIDINSGKLKNTYFFYLFLFLVEANLPTPLGQGLCEFTGYWILLEGKWLFIAGKIHIDRRFSG